jgi:hypothetical protein
MEKRHRPAELPREVITLTSYVQLMLYLAKFAAGELGLVLLLGRHGTGKSESVKQALGISSSPQARSHAASPGVLYIEGHLRPFGLYRGLWEHRDQPVVLDDLDKLYADADCVRLLKPLCNTDRIRQIAWLTNLTRGACNTPASFTTTSKVVLIANEWRSLNPNVRALEDRAIVLHFRPSNKEVHDKVAEWFQDREVYEFIGRLLPLTHAISMRHYCKGSQLRRAGLLDWQTSVIQMVVADPRMAGMLAVQHEPNLRTERQRVERFVATTGFSRATYFRMKARLASNGAARGSAKSAGAAGD